VESGELGRFSLKVRVCTPSVENPLHTIVTAFLRGFHEKGAPVIAPRIGEVWSLKIIKRLVVCIVRLTRGERGAGERERG
jgi:hypothetical protein